MDSSVIAVGIIETFAGNGKSRSTGDGKPAAKAGMPLPVSVAIDPQTQSLYYAESGSDRVRRIELATGIISHVAGIGETCYSGDGGPAAEAGLYLPLDVAFDSKGDLYICDSGSNRIRRVDMKSGIIDTIAGTGEFGFNGDGPALEVNLTYPSALAFDSRARLFIVDGQAHRIRMYDPEAKLITTIAGVCFYGYDGDGKPATQAMLNAPEAVHFDSFGHMYISDAMNHRVRRVEAGTGIITTVAGNGESGYKDSGAMGGCGMAKFVKAVDKEMIKHGDGRVAVEAVVNSPAGLALDQNGFLYICERGENKIRRLKLY